MTYFATCSSYSRSDIESAVALAWDALGDFVKPGMRVLVKPNLLRDATPDEAVTTHPEVVRACLVRLLGAGARVTVGDSPAFVATLANVWKTTGIRAVCDELGIPLTSLEQQGCAVREHEGSHFTICNAALESDLILNLPKVKTHGLTLLTAAAKNLYGLIPGHLKTQLHKTHSSSKRFGSLVRGIVRTLPPVVTIADGVIGMEGDGPSAGTPVRLGFIAAGDDVHALDWHLCEVLGLPHSRVPTLDGIPAPEPARGRVPTLPPVKLPHRSPLSLLDKLPKFVTKIVGRLIWFRPRIAPACVKCGKCVKACPAGALYDKAPTLSSPPKLLTTKCIGCCCCSEVCPVHAITMRSSPLVRFAGWK